MSRGVRWFLIASAALLTLAGCGRGFMQYGGEREPWRREAEVACLNSGTVKESPGIVKISPIEGPGMCGADFPLKVSALGDGSALGYIEEPVRPPGSIAGPSRSAPQPRWPISQQQPQYAPPQPQYAPPQYGPPQAQPGAPMSIEAPGTGSRVASAAAIPRLYPARRRPSAAPPIGSSDVSWLTIRLSRRSAAPPPEIETGERRPCQPGRAPIGDSRTPACRRSVRRAIRTSCTTDRGQARGDARVPDCLRARQLACQLVQLGAQVVQSAGGRVKQISAYSCRGMNGQAGAHIPSMPSATRSASRSGDGHRITAKGLNGSPESGAFRDAGLACDQFTNVPAPPNQFHYDHIHADLMRRASGRRICQPGAVDGEVVASRARGNIQYARRSAPPTRRHDPPVEPGSDRLPAATPAARPTTTGRSRAAAWGQDRRPRTDWVEARPRPAIDWSSNKHKVY